MTLSNAVAAPVAAVEDPRGAAEHELLVNLGELVVPEGVNVEDIGAQKLSSDTARHVFNTLADPATNHGGIVAVGLGVGLLEEREPCLVLILVPAEEEGIGASLVGLAVVLLDVLAVNLREELALQAVTVPVGGLQVELVIDDGVDPFAVCVWRLVRGTITHVMESTSDRHWHWAMSLRWERTPAYRELLPRDSAYLALALTSIKYEAIDTDACDSPPPKLALFLP